MTNERDYFNYKDNISSKYIEDYLSRTRGLKRGANIECIYANEHPKGTDHNPSMGFIEGSNKLHCFTCKKVASLFDLVKVDTGYTKDSDIIRYLRDNYNYNIDYFKNDTAGYTKSLKENRKKNLSIQQVKEIPSVEVNTEYDFTDLIDKASEVASANDKHDSLSMLGYKYYTSRGLTEDTIKRFKLGITNDINDILVNYPNIEVKSPKSKLYKYILPILDEQGNCNSFIAEIINRKEIDNYNAKYRKLNSSSGITTQLFNEYHLKHNRPTTIFLVEGIYDAISIEQMGFNAVGLIGIGASRLENLIKTYKPNTNIVVMLDNDETGKQAGINVLNMLNSLNMQNIKCINGLDILGKYSKISKCKDANDMLLKDSAELKNFLIENYKIINKNEDTDRIDNANISNNLEYFRTIEQQPLAKMVSTGFTELDKNFKGGLRTGLYVLGAVSNLGKTAYFIQLADQIAKQGIPVLYFSLEMDKKELMARSIARTTYIQVGDKKGKNNEPIASDTFDILDNSKYNTYDKDKKDTINVSINIYENVAKNLYIMSGRYKTKDTSRRMTIDDIEKIIKDFIKYKEITPVIFIDYMQIIAPIDNRATDKQNMDEVVDRLKQISIDVDTPVLSISSYNRDNYYEPANVSAFKESGAIEYGADYILALQYQGIDNIYYGTKINSKGNKVPIYNSEADKKRAVYDLIESYKLKSNEGELIPIELKLLKSRNSSKFNMAFSFKARYGYFKEDTFKKDLQKWVEDRQTAREI